MSYGIPYGNPPEGPKSGCRFVVGALIDESHALLRAFTGSLEMSACHTLFDGKIEHAGAPGGGMAAAGTATAITIAAGASARANFPTR
jgi:hypothetical protein